MFTRVKKYSPVHNVNKLKAPVFIVHGEEDVRVPIEHAHALREAMDKYNKEYVWFVKDREAHGFRNEENRAEYFTKLSAFIASYL